MKMVQPPGRGVPAAIFSTFLRVWKTCSHAASAWMSCIFGGWPCFAWNAADLEASWAWRDSIICFNLLECLMQSFHSFAHEGASAVCGPVMDISNMYAVVKSYWFMKKRMSLHKFLFLAGTDSSITFPNMFIFRYSDSLAVIVLKQQTISWFISNLLKFQPSLFVNGDTVHNSVVIKLVYILEQPNIPI
jgi:hypothetical protein